ncbi:MAG: PHP domain-containing protein [Candidatus Aureabacteria bacterium]|nr:PHP domain-containing protein [Candidatus Auribacterota bacterium]
MKKKLTQDLHIHTVFSENDSMVVPQQTVELVSQIAHADIIGISDHIEGIHGERFSAYREKVKKFGFHAGVEVSGSGWITEALKLDVEYFIYHCQDNASEYNGAQKLLSSGKPVIIAHPMVMGTDLSKIPSESYIEINNRYVWQNDWRSKLGPFSKRFRFVISSDAHQPNWLNQNIARHVAAQLGIKESLLPL